MTAQNPQTNKYAAPIREMRFTDQQRKNVKENPPRRSKTSVACYIEETPKKSAMKTMRRGLRRGSMTSQRRDSMSSCLSSTSSTISSSHSSISSSSSSRKVSFRPWVAVKDTLSRHDMTDEEMNNFWFREQDFARIKKHNRKLIKHIERRKSLEITEVNSLDDDNEFDDQIQRDDGYRFCIRGLETGFKPEALKRRSIRQRALHKILSEQEIQMHQNYVDVQALANIYIDVAMQSKFHAVHKAMEDRMDAESYYRAGLRRSKAKGE